MMLLVAVAATIILRSPSSSASSLAAAGFLLFSSCCCTTINHQPNNKRRRQQQRWQHHRKKSGAWALSNNNNAFSNNPSIVTTVVNEKRYDAVISSCCFIPPNFGDRMMVRPPRVVCYLHSVRDGGGEYDYEYDDPRLRIKKQRVQDPIIQDFGSISDWNAMKIGTAVSGNNRNSSMRRRRRLGDDEVNERRLRRPFLLDDDDDEGGGGNFWINPINSMDRYNNYPLPPPPPPPPNAIVDDGALTMMNNRRSRDVAFNRRRSNGGGRDVIMGGGGGTSSNRMRRKVSPGARPSGDGLWYETKRGAMLRDRYDEDYENDDYDNDYFDDDEFDNDVKDERRQREDYYGPPPPTRSRSSFRSGAPPPPRPLKEFYDKLFWFGFDPKTTDPNTDRTMFGGTRGRFNALDLLRDREERQRLRQRQYRGDNYYDDDDYYDEYNGGGDRRRNNSIRRRGNDSIIQDFGTVRDWDIRKNGRGRVGGDAVGDDIINSRGGTFPFPNRPPPPLGDFDDVDYFSLADEDEDDIAGRAMQRRRQRRRQRGGGVMRGLIDPRAEEYNNRFLGLGPPPPPYVGSDDLLIDDNYRQFDRPLSSSSRQQQRRRRRGFAYKYNEIDSLNNDDDDGEYIDIEPLYATNHDLDMAKSRSRSWEERAIERDRVPPRDGIAWGPNGQVIGESPLNMAAMDALRDINKSKRLLVRKEEDVELAKAKVVNLKTDVSFYEEKLDSARGGQEVSEIEQELGEILRDVNDASLKLRLARAERDEASNRVSALEECNWALLSEFEAVRDFEGEEI